MPARSAARRPPAAPADRRQAVGCGPGVVIAISPSMHSTVISPCTWCSRMPLPLGNICAAVKLGWLVANSAEACRASEIFPKRCIAATWIRGQTGVGVLLAAACPIRARARSVPRPNAPARADAVSAPCATRTVRTEFPRRRQLVDISLRRPRARSDTKVVSTSRPATRRSGTGAARVEVCRQHGAAILRLGASAPTAVAEVLRPGEAPTHGLRLPSLAVLGVCYRCSWATRSATGPLSADLATP